MNDLEIIEKWLSCLAIDLFSEAESPSESNCAQLCRFETLKRVTPLVLPPAELFADDGTFSDCWLPSELITPAADCLLETHNSVALRTALEAIELSLADSKLRRVRDDEVVVLTFCWQWLLVAWASIKAAECQDLFVRNPQTADVHNLMRTILSGIIENPDSEIQIPDAVRMLMDTTGNCDVPLNGHVPIKGCDDSENQSNVTHTQHNNSGVYVMSNVGGGTDKRRPTRLSISACGVVGMNDHRRAARRASIEAFCNVSQGTSVLVPKSKDTYVDGHILSRKVTSDSVPRPSHAPPRPTRLRTPLPPVGRTANKPQHSTPAVASPPEVIVINCDDNSDDAKYPAPAKTQAAATNATEGGREAFVRRASVASAEPSGGRRTPSRESVTGTGTAGNKHLQSGARSSISAAGGRIRRKDGSSSVRTSTAGQHSSTEGSYSSRNATFSSSQTSKVAVPPLRALSTRNQAEVSELLRENAALQDELRNLFGEKDVAVGAVAEVQRQLQLQSSTVEKLRMQMDALRASELEGRALLAETERLLEDAITERRAAMETTLSLQVQLTDICGGTTAKEAVGVIKIRCAELQESQTQLTSTKRRLADIESLYERECERTADMAHDVDKYQASIVSLGAQIEVAGSAKLNAASAEAEKLTVDNQRLAAEAQDFKKLLQSQEAELQELRIHLGAVRGELRDAVSNAEKSDAAQFLAESNDMLMEQLTHLRSEMQSLEVAHKELNSTHVLCVD
eukprot:Lankesteria_metandrocarpae@DN32_c0_g1_i1.p1